MLPLNTSCGRLAAFVLAAALTVPGAVSAAGDAAHQQCEREGHACGSAVLVASCCCDGGVVDQSAPASSPEGRRTLTQLHDALLVAPAFMVAEMDVDTVSSAVLRMHAPPHGYYRADLSLLLSILLI